MSFVILLIVGICSFFFLGNTSLAFLSYLIIAGGIVLFGLIVNFFRDPEVPVEPNDDHIFAPCDGKVVVIEEVYDKHWFKENVTQVSIFMSPLNVHVNRNPISGVVRFFRYFPGKYLVAFDPKSSEFNEQTCIVAENDKVAVMYKQIAGYVARRIIWYIHEGDEVDQGDEFGFIRFGSRIDLLFPASCKVQVQLNEVVKAGLSVIATV
jgi:phosphatidylserine decarboxylase